MKICVSVHDNRAPGENGHYCGHPVYMCAPLVSLSTAIEQHVNFGGGSLPIVTHA